MDNVKIRDLLTRKEYDLFILDSIDQLDEWTSVEVLEDTPLEASFELRNRRFELINPDLADELSGYDVMELKCLQNSANKERIFVCLPSSQALQIWANFSTDGDNTLRGFIRHSYNIPTDEELEECALDYMDELSFLGITLEYRPLDKKPPLVISVMKGDTVMIDYVMGYCIRYNENNNEEVL